MLALESVRKWLTPLAGRKPQHSIKPVPVTIDQALLIEYVRSGRIPASVWLDKLTESPELFDAYQNTCRNRQQASVVRMFLENASGRLARSDRRFRDLSAQ